MLLRKDESVISEILLICDRQKFILGGNFLPSLDIYFKVFYVFNLEYHTSAALFMKFLECFIFGIKGVIPSPRLLDFRNTMFPEESWTQFCIL